MGASAAAVALALEPLPAGAPATVTWTPPAASTSRLVAAVLDELDRVACQLYPAWLPGAAGLDSTAGTRLAAVRVLARQRAAATRHFGPFLMDLAERAVGGSGNGRLAAQVRAAGLARVIADSYARPHSSLLVMVPGKLPVAARDALLPACEWLAHHGELAVWLAGETGETDRASAVPVALPAHLAALDSAYRAPAATDAAVRYPPLAGQPHPGSEAEQALEAALAALPWAAGRTWNQAWQPHPLASPVRVDLMWQRERCAVEIDGPEHAAGVNYQADRQRDVLLQLAGFAVLRFTNQQVHRDLGTVLAQIEQFLSVRRTGEDPDAPQ